MQSHFSHNHKLLCHIALVLTLGLQMPFLQAQAPNEVTPNDPANTPNSTTLTGIPTTESTALFVTTVERDNALLALALPNEIQWLETPHEKIIALFKAGETRKTKGTLLILHAPELPQLWPAALENLRRNLPLYGWDTLAVPLPTQDKGHDKEQEQEQRIANNDSSTTNSSNTNSSMAAESSIAASSTSSTPSSAPSTATTNLTPEIKSPLSRAQLITERIAAATILLAKIGQANRVVLIDNSSAPESLPELYKTKIQALVLVNLQHQEPLTQAQLNIIFSVPELPILDVFFGAKNAHQIAMCRLHQAEARRKNVAEYQQVILPPEHQATLNDPHSFWLEKVRGFMEKKTKGDNIKQ
jgi:hypothetical protein